MAHVRSPRRLALLVAAVTTFVVVALLAGAPGHLSHAWQDFRHSSAAGRNQTLARFGAVSGNRRYDHWKVAINSTGRHLLNGSGAGTFQLYRLHVPFLQAILRVRTFAGRVDARRGSASSLLSTCSSVSSSLVPSEQPSGSASARASERVSRRAGFTSANVCAFLRCSSLRSDFAVNRTSPRRSLVLAGPMLRAPATQIPRRHVATISPRCDYARSRRPRPPIAAPARDESAPCGRASGRARWQLGAGAGRRARRAAARPGRASAQIQSRRYELQGRVPEALAAAAKRRPTSRATGADG